MATQDQIESLYVSGPNSIGSQSKSSLSEILGSGYNFDKPIKEIRLDLMDKGFKVSKKSQKSKPTKVATAKQGGIIKMNSGGLAKRGYGKARRG
jgi:hypothetical protein|tara:strand:- start:90 stop:371 length:282 start_codon:yes stop_codon:yes gene_type:complete